MPADIEKARALFVEAVGKHPPDQWEAFLEERCKGDIELQTQVRHLLRAHTEAGSFLETPAVEPGCIEALDAPGAPPDDTTQPETDPMEEPDLGFLGPPQQPDHLGTFGPYQVIELVGHGGMAVVLKGNDPKLNRIVAVKVLAPHWAANRSAGRRFQREAQAAAAIRDDHVVGIHTVDEANGLPYLVMEYIDGESLQERLDRTGPLKLKEILRIGMQTAAGLAAAHAQGIIHRDIKPANILLENGVERVKITDFGLARAIDDVHLTQVGVVAGTPQYMSPRQARGEPTDHRADLFSLGSVLYTMCTGRAPFRADTTLSAMRRVCEDNPRPIGEVNPDIPRWLIEIIEKLHAKDPEDRFQSAAEVTQLLNQHLAHLQDPQPLVTKATVAQVAERAAVRKRKWAVASALLVVGATLGVTESTGVTRIIGTLTRAVMGEGTLVVHVDDPSTSIRIDDAESSAHGTNLHEVRLTAGPHTISGIRDGSTVWRETVRIARGVKFIVQIGREDDAIRLEGLIHRAMFSPDGRFLLVGGGNTGIEPLLGLYDSMTGAPVRQFSGHTATVECATFSPDGRFVISGSQDQTLRLWNADTAEELHQFEGHDGWVMNAAFSAEGRFVASGGAQDRMICIWDVASGREQRRCEGHTDSVTSLAFSTDGRQLLSGSADGTVRLWDTQSGSELRRFAAGAKGILAVAFSPDGTYVGAGGMANTATVRQRGKVDDAENCLVWLWDRRTGKLIRRFHGHHGNIQSIAFSPEGQFLASGSGGGHYGPGPHVPSDDNTVRLWDVETGNELCRFLGHSDTVRSVAFSANGRRIVSCGYDSTVRLWEMPIAVTK